MCACIIYLSVSALVRCSVAYTARLLFFYYRLRNVTGGTTALSLSLGLAPPADDVVSVVDVCAKLQSGRVCVCEIFLSPQGDRYSHGYSANDGGQTDRATESEDIALLLCPPSPVRPNLQRRRRVSEWVRGDRMEAIAKHDFTATAEDELSFRRSQVLKVSIIIIIVSLYGDPAPKWGDDKCYVFVGCPM